MAETCATDPTIRARYDLVTNYRCGGSIEEMERSDDGEWVRFEDAQEFAQAIAARERERCAQIADRIAGAGVANAIRRSAAGQEE